MHADIRIALIRFLKVKLLLITSVTAKPSHCNPAVTFKHATIYILLSILTRSLFHPAPGRSDPQISTSIQESHPVSRHSSSSWSGSHRNSPPSPHIEVTGSRGPRSPRNGVLKRQAAWEGQSSSVTQSSIGPVV